MTTTNLIEVPETLPVRLTKVYENLDTSHGIQCLEYENVEFTFGELRDMINADMLDNEGSEVSGDRSTGNQPDRWIDWGSESDTIHPYIQLGDCQENDDYVRDCWDAVLTWGYPIIGKNGLRILSHNGSSEVLYD